MNNKIIVMFEGKDKVLNISLYDYINEQYRKSNPILVCNVTQEEFELMEKEIKTVGALSEMFPMIMKDDIPYNQFRYLLAYDKKNNKLALADYNNSDSKGSYIIDEKGIYFKEKEIQFPKNREISKFCSREHKVYTTESYKDVLYYYQNRGIKSSI